MAAVTAVVQWLLVLALLVGHSQGQSEASITGLVDNNTLTEWGLFTGTTSQLLSQGLVSSSERQFLFPGLRFRCSGTVTKWIVGAAFRDMVSLHPALGIYRDQTGGGFADRVGATVLVQSNVVPSRVYEFTPDPPLPFQTNDSLGVYLPPDIVIRLRLFHRRVTGAPASRNYVPSNPPAEGVPVFNFTSAPTEETDLLPLVAVEIESDDPDSADCTRDFISRDLLELLAHTRIRPSGQQIVFPSYNFTSDGNITSWTVAASWRGDAGRIRFPELQIWRRSSGDTYNRIASTALTATAESPRELYSSTIDPPLQFQSGDLLGMYIPPNNNNGGSRLLVYFGDEAGSTYEFRNGRNAPLSAITVGQLTNNHRPFLALEIIPTVPTTATSTTPAATAASTSIIPASPPTTGVTSASPPTELLPVIAIAVGASVGGVVLAAVVTVLIIVAAVACARKKKQNPKDRSVDAINMTATAEDTYDYPFHEPAAVATKRNEAYASTAIITEQNEAYASTAITTEQNEAYASTAITTEQNEAYASTSITTEQNEAYASTAITTEQNEAYATTRGGDTATDEYEYI